MRHDFCVVGGGIVGLATAREILRRRPGASLVLIEKEADLATHQTGHNSGVIHAGVYYAPGSLKARLCRAGNQQTKQFCAEHGIPIEECGKLIVATTAIEVQRLADLRKRCDLNGIATQEVAGTDLATLEPRIAGRAALLVPSTGIVDYRRVAVALAEDIREHGGEVRLRSCVRSITERSAEVEVVLTEGEPICASQLIACAGLQADRLARLPANHVCVHELETRERELLAGGSDHVTGEALAVKHHFAVELVFGAVGAGFREDPTKRSVYPSPAWAATSAQ